MDARSASQRVGYAGFRRNVAVGLGLATLEEPPEEAVAVLRDALDDERELVREHAAWVLGRASGGDENSERSRGQANPRRVVSEYS
jgi:HEAT repeat protein